LDSYYQFPGTELNDQSQRYIEHLHVAEQLSITNGMNRLNGFDFNQQTMVNQQSEAVSPGETVCTG
jgi:hypothetical protein